jgi:inosine-uridine nucleoside N-ribohydrolase
VEREIAGHEFWSPDGKRVWFDLQIPRGETFFLAGADAETGEEVRYALTRDQWSVHYNISPDGSLFCGDGGSEDSVAGAKDGKWIYLFRPDSDRLRAERLCSLATHDYDLEPNVHFTPDARWVVFRANMHGPSQVYAVEIQRSPGPVPVIFDTDMDSDCDDLGALAVLHALADQGEAKILGVVTTTDNAFSPLCADAINTYYGRPDIPIGVLDPKAGGSAKAQSRYTKEIAEEFPHDLASYGDAEDAVELYRRTLAGQPDNSVVLITVGHLTSLRRLMDSAPDRHSPLNGIDLLRKKVRFLSCMGGKYPAGKEANFYRPDPASTVRVVNDFPRPIMFSGGEIGAAIQTGARLAETPETNPVRRGYARYLGGEGKTRSSWDQTAVLYAVRGLRDCWSAQSVGYCHVFEDGSNEWRSSPDRAHAYLIQDKPAAEMAKIIEELMIRKPSR